MGLNAKFTIWQFNKVVPSIRIIANHVIESSISRLMLQRTRGHHPWVTCTDWSLDYKSIDLPQLEPLEILLEHWFVSARERTLWVKQNISAYVKRKPANCTSNQGHHLSVPVSKTGSTHCHFHYHNGHEVCTWILGREEVLTITGFFFSLLQIDHSTYNCGFRCPQLMASCSQVSDSLTLTNQS